MKGTEAGRALAESSHNRNHAPKKQGKVITQSSGGGVATNENSNNEPSPTNDHQESDDRHLAVWAT